MRRAPRRGIPAAAVLSRGINRAMFAPRVFVGTRPDDDGSDGLCWREDCGRPHHEHTGDELRCPADASVSAITDAPPADAPPGRFSINAIFSAGALAIPRETLLATDWLLWLASEQPEDCARITAMVQRAVRGALQSRLSTCARTASRGRRGSK